jgi:ankyrin repeat protein
MRLFSVAKSIVYFNAHGSDHDKDGGNTGSVRPLGEDTITIQHEFTQAQIFNQMCCNTTEGNLLGWEQIRDWLKSHSEDEVRDAVCYTGDRGMTSLHYVAQNNPPLDIVRKMIYLGHGALLSPDDFNWMPLHYACACGASSEVQLLISEAAPEAKTVFDRRGRAPIHFAISNNARGNLSTDVVASLISTGAGTFPDESGMLPLHYGCAYGASVEIISTLVQANPDALLTTDSLGRTPFVFCLANCDRDYSAAVVRFMLQQNQDLVNLYQGDQIPLLALSEHAHSIKERNGMVNASKCLELYMNAEPTPGADLISALQQLPEWLLEDALDLPIVHVLLNQKISQPFPTAVLMSDFYFLILMVVSLSILIEESLHLRSDDDTTNDALGPAKVLPLYIGVAYFFARECIQFVGVVSLGAVSTYLADATNLIDILYIGLILYWTVLMQTGTGNDEVFRMGTALTMGLVYINVMSYLKNVIIDLAIFVAGVRYVVKRLGAFLMATLIFLVAFSQIFMTLFQQTDYCDKADNLATALEDIHCPDDDAALVWCDFWSAFLRVLTMMLGDINEGDFTTSASTIAYIVFFFLVAILLANVLIAIVTNSYAVVRNERASIVFWRNRLDFVAEMDAIAHGPWTHQFKTWLRIKSTIVENGTNSARQAFFGSGTWNRFLAMFEDEVEGLGLVSWDSWRLFFSRLLIAFFILPAWILLGLVTAGTLWPPEVREFVFVDTIATRLGSNDGNDNESAEQQRSLEIETIQEEISEMKDELAQQAASDRIDVVNVKKNLTKMKATILEEVKFLKESMARLIEHQARVNSSLS